MEVLHRWDTSLTRVRVAAQRIESGPVGDRLGTFFSGGVDSFYTLLRFGDEITDLILVHGFDIALRNAPLRRAASEIGAAELSRCMAGSR
jgi:hypothetical protein